MDRIVYGVVAPPTLATALAFGSDVEPKFMAGGHGTADRAGNIVLKPAGDAEEESWTAELFERLPESSAVRFARPIKSVEGTWIHDHYVAWTFLQGDHVNGQYEKKLAAGEAFHCLLKGIPKPPFLNAPRDSWSAASEVVLEHKGFPYDQEFVDLYNQVKPHLRPLPSDRQPVHGDLSGNFLLDPSLPPAIIDFSREWAPNGFAEGIMLADIVAWEHATDDELKAFKNRPDISQLAWYGVLQRIAEQPEHMKWFGKSKEEAVDEARSFLPVIEFLSRIF
jgi:hypothetical protein